MLYLFISYYAFSIFFMIGWTLDDMKYQDILGKIILVSICAIFAPILMPTNIGEFIKKQTK